MKRLISMLLAVMLAVALMPATDSYAAEPTNIESLTVTVTPPVAGQKSSEVRPQLSISDTNSVLTNPSWMYSPDIYSTDEPDVTFESGNTYYIYALIKANAGYEFLKGDTSYYGNDEGFRIFEGCTVEGGEKLFAASRTFNDGDYLRVKIAVQPAPAPDPDDDPFAAICYFYRKNNDGTYFIGASSSGSEFTAPTSTEAGFAGWDVTGLDTDMHAFRITKAQADAGYNVTVPTPVSGKASCSVTFTAYYEEPAPAHTHTYKTVTDPAGYLKNGYTYQECTECGAKTAVTVLEGWSNPYAKAVKVKKGKKSFNVKWKKQSKKNQKQFNGYQIRYSTDPNFSNAMYKTAGKKSSGKKIKGAAKTRYYVQVRTYKNVNGVRFYSAWSAVKTAKTK